jgi:hypothetical protein
MVIWLVKSEIQISFVESVAMVENPTKTSRIRGHFINQEFITRVCIYLCLRLKNLQNESNFPP